MPSNNRLTPHSQRTQRAANPPQQSHGQSNTMVDPYTYPASSDGRAPVHPQTYTSNGYLPPNPQPASVGDIYATSVYQQEPQQAGSTVSGHTRHEGRQPQSSNLRNPEGSKCRLPDCVQPQLFDDRKQEYLDYCRNHIYTAVSRGFAAGCRRCRDLPARHDSGYCSRYCSSAANVMGTSVVRQQHTGSVPPGFAPTCQECRRPMPDAVPNQRFCSPECDRHQQPRH